jgi:hypothetical protein
VPFVSRITVAQSSSARAQYRSSAARCTDRSKRQSRSGRVKPHHCRLNAARLTSGGRSQSWVSARAPRCRRRVQPRVSRPFASRLSSSATPKSISPIPNRDTQVSCETDRTLSSRRMRRKADEGFRCVPRSALNGGTRSVRRPPKGILESVHPTCVIGRFGELRHVLSASWSGFKSLSMLWSVRLKRRAAQPRAVQSFDLTPSAPRRSSAAAAG